MRARLRTAWERIGNSLWFLPGLMTLGAFLFAWLMLRVQIELGETSVWWLHGGSAEDAADLLSTVLGSMITMATLAISITMVVLTLAAGQLGPRLIRSFIADRRTQAALGIFLGTIVYLVVILRTLNDSLPDKEVAHAAVTVGTALLLLCVIVLLAFIHHLARSIVSDTVVWRVGVDLDQAIRRLLPESEDNGEAPDVPSAPSWPEVVLSSPKGGYVQLVDVDRLTRCAAELGVTIELTFRPGHHLLPGGRHIRVYPATTLTSDAEATILDCVVIGAERTATQDLEFSIRQLVEVALRALSSGINDPYTAAAVIDRLGASLALMMQRGSASAVSYDDQGVPRVVGPVSTFEGLVDTAFNQIRQAGERQPAILIHLLGVLGQLAGQARTDDHRRVLLDHSRMVAQAGQRLIHEPRDLAALEERQRVAITLLVNGGRPQHGPVSGAAIDPSNED